MPDGSGSPDVGGLQTNSRNQSSAKLLSAQPQQFQNKTIRQFNYPRHVNNPLNRLYFRFIIFAAIEKPKKGIPL